MTSTAERLGLHNRVRKPRSSGLFQDEAENAGCQAPENPQQFQASQASRLFEASQSHTGDSHTDVHVNVPCHVDDNNNLDNLDNLELSRENRQLKNHQLGMSPEQPGTREVRYRRHGDAVLHPHRSASVPADLPGLFAAAAWLDDEGHGPVAEIEGGDAPESPGPSMPPARVARFRPPRGSIVDRIEQAGGQTSIAGYRADGTLFKHAWLPAGTDSAFVEELKADDWTTSDREATEAYVARCWARAEAALANVTDADRGEVGDE